MKKNLISCVCFLLIFCLLTAGFYRIFQYRFEDEDGIEGIKQLYRIKENSVDVLCLGSSHMFVDVNTAVLWEEYGIAAFDLGGTIQPFWNTYFYLKEALKTQKPKLLVLDCYAATLTEEYADESGIIKNTFGMKLSGNKIDAIKVSAPDKKLSYLLGYPGYHARYSVLGKQDFVKNRGIADYESWKGNHFVAETAAHVAKLRNDNIREIKETEAIYPKEEEYLQKIIDLAQQENIPLLLIAAPYFPTEREIRIFNRVEELASANQVPFINYNYFYDEMGLELASDFADGHHLNIKGSPKFTRFLAEDIKASYVIPDRRGEAAYSDYEVMTDAYHQRVKNQMLTEFAENRDLEGFFNAAEGGEYLLVLGVGEDLRYHENYIWLRDRLNKYDIGSDVYSNTLCKDSPYQILVVDTCDKNTGKPVILFSHETDRLPDTSGNIWHSDLGVYDTVSVRCPNEKDMQNGYSSVVIEFDNQVYCTENNMLTIFVYDRRTRTGGFHAF